VSLKRPRAPPAGRNLAIDGASALRETWQSAFAIRGDEAARTGCKPLVVASFLFHTALQRGSLGRRRRKPRGPTDDWKPIELLCVRGEQSEYERIRPLHLFDGPIPERSTDTRIPESSLCSKMASFDAGGVGNLFGSSEAKRRVLPPTIRKVIVDKAEHPTSNLEEIANVCAVRFGRELDSHNVKPVLEEFALSRKLVGAFRPTERRGRRGMQEVRGTLNREGWPDKSIARYPKVDRFTVYRAKKRFKDRGRRTRHPDPSLLRYSTTALCSDIGPRADRLPCVPSCRVLRYPSRPY
jgi:hypothetical protein